MSIDRKLGAAAAYLRPGPDRKPGRIALSADVDGVEAFLARGDTKILRLILEHELIHKEQHRRTNWKPGLLANGARVRLRLFLPPGARSPWGAGSARYFLRNKALRQPVMLSGKTGDLSRLSS